MPPANLRSMTGFGRAEGEGASGRFVVEVKSINSRFLEIKVFLPPGMGALESHLRALLGGRIDRGKIECRVRFLPKAGETHHAYFNEPLILKYIETLRALRQNAGLAQDVSLDAVLQLPGAIEDIEENMDPDLYWPVLAETARAAIDELQSDRQREGAALAETLLNDLAELRRRHRAIMERRSAVIDRFREKLTARVAELQTEVRAALDRGRLELEVAMLADRLDVSEELSRLEAHLNRLEELIQNREGGAVGKALDFLVQEILREVNTTSSKLRDLDVVRETLEMKAAVERIREQVQNVV